MHQLKVYVSAEDQWVLDALKSIVQTKKNMGYQSSLSFEVMRCVRNSLTQCMVGTELDTQILLRDTDVDP